MAIRYSLVESNTTDIPTNAATTFNRGFNLPGGPIDEFIIRMTITAGADPIAADMSNIMNSVRLILNGSTVHDFRSGYAAAANHDLVRRIDCCLNWWYFPDVGAIQHSNADNHNSRCCHELHARCL